MSEQGLASPFLVACFFFPCFCPLFDADQVLAFSSQQMVSDLVRPPPPDSPPNLPVFTSAFFAFVLLFPFFYLDLHGRCPCPRQGCPLSPFLFLLKGAQVFGKPPRFVLFFPTSISFFQGSLASRAAPFFTRLPPPPLVPPLSLNSTTAASPTYSILRVLPFSFQFSLVCDLFRWE